ncbi:hypothetical protein [Providencia heimbachae]|uniref:Uncharacterized protein n=1 Tax=Providencia heimbachae ATCC 35613 TaxID=1354272 RepID=A0A1B7JWE9_9GAMM|nr:hypothetical protein [Providencia heimbachae]OAT52205.1 hypothetical protein M998_1619 [Providencia heimbachae ATCC 35613]SQH14998.1 Uncharacterised protein [Providencia heimbachae]
MKYFSFLFFILLFPLSGLSAEYEENHYFPLHDATSANKMKELSGKINFKIGIMYSPCIISSEEYIFPSMVIKLNQCLVNTNDMKIPLQAKIKLIYSDKRYLSGLKMDYKLTSGSNDIYIPQSKFKGNSLVMELEYD